jgi:hypothetical protein
MKRLLIVAIFLMLSIGVSYAAALEDGIAAFNAKNYEKALPLLQPEAEQGVAAAQGLLARLYANGWGTPKDREAALKWARLAAAKGDATGQSLMGYMYRNGFGVTKDYAEALKWYRLSADQGNPFGQSSLAYMYLSGFGVTKDYAEALKWYRLAAAQSDGESQSQVGHIYYSGFGVAKDYVEALKWFRLSADQGNVLGQSNLGNMYDCGCAVSQSYEEAARWYLLAAAQGSEYSKKKLDGSWAIKMAAERVTAKGTNQTPTELLQNAVVQTTYLQEAKVKEQERLAQETRTNELARVEQDAKAKAQERLAQETRAKELARAEQDAKAQAQERLAQETRAKELARAEQDAKAQAQERLAQETRAKELARAEQEAKAQAQVRLAQETRAKEIARIEQEAKAKALERLAQIEEAKNANTQQTLFANRRALVIGNDNYKNVSPLLNAREDAKAIAANLQQFGYQVTLKMDLTEKEMKSALRTFKGQVEGGDEVLFFYAGHGVQLGTANYLLPIDIVGESEEQVKDEAIQLQRILDDLTERKAKFSLAMIDACRDNPFRTAGRTLGGRGLSPTTAATGQMVIFSAGVGQQALDKLGPKDTSKNGLFTRIFLQEMQKPGVSIDRVVRNVRNQVVSLAKSVGHEQVPAIYDQVVGDFYFRK